MTITSPVKAIRAKCLDCCMGSPAEVKRCHISDCELHPFRFGKNPYSKRKLSEEQRQAASERLKNYHETQRKQGDQEDSVS